ncbi:MAG: 3-deoxy-7-phosphoheptulonate synthase [Epulopiscium sp.]|nr:3-deoxy-7-phosphoheptulonate synthase [Candidatus Epulonipiscium sp.]
MSFKYLRKIPSTEEIINEIPFSNDLALIKQKRDAQIKAVIEKKSDQFLLIIGPCSAHDEDAVCDYVNRLAKVQEKVKEKIIIIPRIYTNKPRTTGEGYKGMLHQPDPTEKPNILEGLKAIRRMHIRAISESHLTPADEMLYPENYTYLEDVLSYVAIGARSVEDQQHRLTVSGMDVPVGMKNPTSGDISVMLNSIHAAQHGHTFLYQGWEVKTTGNPLAHAILRGAVNHYGTNIPNYHYEDMMYLASEYEERGLLNPTIIVDTNHANSMKKYKEQPRIVKEILYSRKHSTILKDMVRGLMIESYIVEGNQKPDEKVYGKSITDPCLGWDDSEQLIYYIAENV